MYCKTILSFSYWFYSCSRESFTFQKKSSRKNIKLIIKIDDQIRDEKLKYDSSREAAKISALSSGKIEKYEYLTGKQILPYNRRQIIEQAKFAYSPLGNSFEKQTEKQLDAIKSLEISNKKEELKEIESIFPQNLANNLICAKLREIVKLQNILPKNDLNYKSKRGTTYKFMVNMVNVMVNIHYLLLFKGYTWRIFIIRKCWLNQNIFAIELKNFEKVTKTLEKVFFK